MGTLWVCHFPSCITLPCGECKLSLTHQHHFLQPAPIISLPLSLGHFHVRASQTTNARTRTRTRRSRRLKSDAEICNDIRQFLASVGLPEDHIPSTKELLHHGRNELANIVRRRGHKQLKELLTNSLNADIDSLNTEQSLDERLVAANDCEGLLTGQNEKVDSLVDDVSASTEFLQGNSSSSFHTDSTLSLDECTSIPVESSVNSSMEDGLGELNNHAEVVNDVAEGNFYPTEVTIVDNGQYSMPTEISGESTFERTSFENSECEDSLVGGMDGEITFPSLVPSVENHSNTSFSDSDLSTGEKEFSHSEPSIDLSLEEKDLCASEGLDDRNYNITEDVPTTSEFSFTESVSGENKIDSIIHSADSSCINLDTSANLSLEEKVANFIQNGDLDPVEDHVSGISNGDDSQESKLHIESEPVVDMPLGVYHPKDNNVMTFNENSQDAKVQNQSEINHLKFMLYQKELELSQLKEQIENEKLALAVLQTKAEAEISKARKLIAEKDAELNVAEESLSGLKEVQVEFCGDGDVVEVAGSFNGWHHQIKMDPEPSTSVEDLSGSRRSRFWSTMLWLYPGVYEIKFVVDGHWTTDPQQETVTRGHICNNILRVDR